MLESMVAAAQNLGFHDAMYTAVGASWSTNFLVDFGLAAYSSTLGRYWAGSALACASRSLNRSREGPFGCDAAKKHVVSPRNSWL
jgi:hypothetical protein